jgi:hypothetical protein
MPAVRGIDAKTLALRASLGISGYPAQDRKKLRKEGI